MAQTAFVLIVTADTPQGEELAKLLRTDHDHSCRVVDSLDTALESIQVRAPDVVVAGAEVHGVQTARPLLEALDRHAPDSTLLIVGVVDDEPTPESIEFRTLPQVTSVDGLATLVAPIARAADQAVARREDRLLSKSIDSREITDFEGIVGDSPVMHRIIERIKKAARNKLTVLILGETGSGKELIARAIHNRSQRARRPFRAINCAGISETLVESELFGHVRGAFTGAVADKPGLFMAADGGTLFLDEIGDMPLLMQAKLLRVLETREVTPVGSHEIQRVDVRVIAATNAALRERIENKEFREDLYYRLNQWVIEIPPLRERRQDVPILAVHLLRLANETHGTQVSGFSREALDALMRYAWPGNIRELRNLIEGLANEVERGRIELRDLPEEITGSRELALAGSEMPFLPLDQVERMMVQRALLLANGNREQAAKMLGIGTRTLYRKIKDFDLAE